MSLLRRFLIQPELRSGDHRLTQPELSEDLLRLAIVVKIKPVAVLRRKECAVLSVQVAEVVRFAGVRKNSRNLIVQESIQQRISIAVSVCTVFLVSVRPGRFIGTSDSFSPQGSAPADLSNTWAEMKISNNFMFTKILESNKPLCMELLSRIFPDEEIGDIQYIEAEKSIQNSYDSKGIRLDVMARDGRHLFDLEMQVTSDAYLPKRARYYNSVLDIEQSYASMDYRYLQPTYVIFICPFAVFDKKGHLYDFRRYNRLDRSVELADGTSLIFLSTEGIKDDIDKPLRNFLDYVKRVLNPAESDDAFIQDVNQLGITDTEHGVVPVLGRADMWPAGNYPA